MPFTCLLYTSIKVNDEYFPIEWASRKKIELANGSKEFKYQGVISKKDEVKEKFHEPVSYTHLDVYKRQDKYKDALGHSWDKGHNVTDATCDGEGVIEYNCLNCNEKMIKAESAKGHTPGKSATCTEPQTCVECGAILELPKGHSYKTKTVKPTCTSMGYTVYSCKECDNTYEGDYIDKMPVSYTHLDVYKRQEVRHKRV